MQRLRKTESRATHASAKHIASLSQSDLQVEPKV